MSYQKIAFINFLLSIFLLTESSYGQENQANKVEIQVKDRKTNHPVEGVRLNIGGIENDKQTGEEGYLKLNLPDDRYSVNILHPSYKFANIQLHITRDTTLIFQLAENFSRLEPVVISDSRIDEKVEQNRPGIGKLSAQQVAELPAMAGEPDIVKALSLLPGIQNSHEGSADLIVRGGTPDQNLYLMDNMTIYHSGHLMGFFSTYNPVAMGDIRIYKGGFPARYGGRLSSVLDVKTKNAEMDSLSGTVQLSPIAGKLFVNAPLVEDKLGIQLSGRRTLIDQMIKGYNKYIGTVSRKRFYNFYDMNGKVTFRPDSNNRISLHTYGDRDTQYRIESAGEEGINAENRQTWKNRMASLQWRAHLGEGIKNHLTLGTTYYNMQLLDKRQEGLTSDYSSNFTSSITDYTLKNRMEINLSPAMNMEAGVNLTRHAFQSAQLNYQSTEEHFIEETLPGNYADDFALYSEVEADLTNKVTSVAGLRWNFYQSGDQRYSHLGPRLGLRYQPNAQSAFKASYSSMFQPIHLLTDPGLGKPLELYVSSNENIRPETANQVTLGYNHSFSMLGDSYSVNLEPYYKQMQGIITYKNGFSSQNFTSLGQSSPNAWETMMTRGTGQSQGIELQLKKLTGSRFTGRMSYTLSHTTHQFPDLNEGEPFLSPYDQTHNFSIAGKYRLPNNWDLHFSWVFSSGQPITLPEYYYGTVYFNYLTGSTRPKSGDGVPDMYSYSDRNAHRMKSFHRLNISASKKYDYGWSKGTLKFGLYNVYNRKNPYYYYIDTHKEFYSKPAYEAGKQIKKYGVKSVSLFPIMPSVSFKLEF